MKNVRELETYGAILIGCGIMAYTLMLASVDAPVWATIEFVMGTLFMVVGVWCVSLGGIAGMQERMERAYEKKSEQGEKPIYEPKDFHVIDEIKDPRELAEELREALNPSTTIDEKISFLEEIAAQNGGQL